MIGVCIKNGLQVSSVKGQQQVPVCSNYHTGEDCRPAFNKARGYLRLGDGLGKQSSNHQGKETGVMAMKCYTHSNNWTDNHPNLVEEDAIEQE